MPHVYTTLFYRSGATSDYSLITCEKSNRRRFISARFEYVKQTIKANIVSRHNTRMIRTPKNACQSENHLRYVSTY